MDLKLPKKSPKQDSMSASNEVIKSNTTAESSASQTHQQSNLMIEKPKKKKKRWWLRILLTVIFIGLCVAGGFAYKTYRSLNKVIQKNTGQTAEGLKTENVALDKLKGEGDGRVNILLLGVGDPGHAGEELSDTIIVASYDPKTKDVAMLGIPRDLYVKISGNGFSKINAAYAFGEQQKKGSGPTLAKKTVSDLLGIPIHYYIVADFTALKQAVDTVGGVDVTVPTTLVDPDYPCGRNEGKVCGFSLLAGPQHLNGSAALKYVRCRKGDCGDDYGRAKRQQEVLVALRQKSLKLDIFTNPAKIGKLLDIVGNNVRTDLQLGELERLAQIAKEADPTKITNKVLDNSTTNLVKNSQVGDASVVIPANGIGNYSAIQAFVRTIFVDGYIKQENASVQVENGTPVSNRGKLVTDQLKSYNYNVIATVPADLNSYKITKIFDTTGGKKPYTLQYLEKRFGVKAVVVPVDPNIPAPADIRIIVGADYKNF
ncbi:LCP family protein [Candidatus Saccharibacteria bacterium]|nr:LCP family protein [Candidatus Saccharibacteria bacterium]